MTARTHSLTRTSPKGQPFFGTCCQCGQKNLPMIAVEEPCINPVNLTQGESLLMAIKDGQ